MIDIGRSPQAGSGVNDWLLATSKKLIRERVEQDEALDALLDAVADCGREVRVEEVIRQWERALAWIESGGTIADDLQRNKSRRKRGKVSGLPPLVRDPGLRLEAILGNPNITYERLGMFNDWVGFSLSDLWSDNYLICYGTSYNNMDVLPLDAVGKLKAETLQFIVPSPMWKYHGKNRDGTVSKRCNDNVVSPRHYIVVEFDEEPDLDNQARMLWYLKRYCPLKMVVYSGGKSLHGWYRCKQWKSSQTAAFFRKAVALGADRRMWVPCQYCRFPGGVNRRTERLQKVVYLDRNVEPCSET